MLFETWSALIDCNASIDEQLAFWRGEKHYPVDFLAHLISISRGRRLVALHSQDAANRKPKGKRK